MPLRSSTSTFGHVRRNDLKLALCFPVQSLQAAWGCNELAVLAYQRESWVPRASTAGA